MRVRGQRGSWSTYDRRHGDAVRLTEAGVLGELGLGRFSKDGLATGPDVLDRPVHGEESDHFFAARVDKRVDIAGRFENIRIRDAPPSRAPNTSTLR